MSYITKKPNGNFLCRFSFGIRNGKQNQGSVIFCPSAGITPSQALAEAKFFAAGIESAIKSGEVTSETLHLYAIKDKMVLSDFIPQYKDKIRRILSPNTCELYNYIIDEFIVPNFGNYRLCDITAKHLQEFIYYLEINVKRKDGGDNGFDPATAKRYATAFSSIMNEAMECGIVHENPFHASKMHYRKKYPHVIEIYSRDEVKALLKALKSEPPMIALLLATAILLGLRRGEIVALKWSDINFEDKSIQINKAAYKVKDHPQALKTPKSPSGSRKVYFYDDYLNSLVAWKNEQERLGAKCDDFVFTTNKGNWISLDSTAKICRNFQDRHKLRHLHLHALRHTYASLIMANGTDVETVRSVLGHESIHTTQIYLHTFDEKKRDVAKALSMSLEVTDETENTEPNSNCISTR